MTGAGASDSGGVRAARSSPGLIAGAAGLGFVIGLLTYVISPTAVSGVQLVAGVLGVVLVLLGIVVRWRRALLGAVLIAGGAGLLPGIAIGYNLRSDADTAGEVAIVVTLEEPAIATLRTTSGNCAVRGDELLLLESPDAVALVDGRSISVTLSRGAYRPAPDVSPDGLTVDVRIASALDDGSPTETWMGSDSTSSVEVTGTAEEGSVAFSGLVLRPDSEQHDPIDVVGSISWSCEAP